VLAGNLLTNAIISKGVGRRIKPDVLPNKRDSKLKKLQRKMVEDSELVDLMESYTKYVLEKYGSKGPPIEEYQKALIKKLADYVDKGGYMKPKSDVLPDELFEI
jgi:hypothetical protein